MTQSRAYILLASVGSATLLAAAFLFQAAGYAPCHLCLLQRWPHLVAVIIGAAMLVFHLRSPFAYLGGLAALTTAGIGIYHSLVERHIIAGPTSCTSGGPGLGSVDDLLDQINRAPLIQCDQISWEMFGVTMANLNVVFSLVLWVLWMLAARSGARS
ncbi:disulfide bond formation protein B [Thioclava sp. GXIMD4216]|uniref:disulfide bond formation protein B n=1 Tax=unclassified Thioclava TaxID=2621713 RepID=UPI0030D29329